MNQNPINFQIDDLVEVKEGVKDPDFDDWSIAGWQGKVVDIIEEKDGGTLICVRWNKETLKEMPDFLIKRCKEKDLDYKRMNLDAGELTSVKPKEKEETKEEKADESLQETSYNDGWSCLGEEGKRIQKVVAGIDDRDWDGALQRWGDYFEENLTFPFEAKVYEPQSRGPLQVGDKVSVKKIAMINYGLYGVIVELRQGRKKYSFPLADLEVIPKDSPNYQPVKDYAIWFANL